MSKCLMCHTKKAKRRCKIVDGLVCSLCCGTIRNEDECLGCEHYKSPQESRKYNKAPHFMPSEMNASQKLQDISEYIESAFCSMDAYYEYNLIDIAPKTILQKLLDKYHYKDNKIIFKDKIIEKWFGYIDTIIKNKLLDMVDEQTLVKIIGAIYFVLNRRTTGKREYLMIIHKHVGDENGVMVLD